MRRRRVPGWVKKYADRKARDLFHQGVMRGLEEAANIAGEWEDEAMVDALAKRAEELTEARSEAEQ